MLITKETANIEKILIDFLSFLNENGYINDYDFVYEKQIKKFIKQIKTNKMEKILKNNETAKLGIGTVIGWVSVSDELPKEHKHRMSRDVLTIDGSKMSVNSYDFELGRWNGSPHITVTHWMELPLPPSR